MSLWQVLNSPLILTVITLLGGGLAVSAISAMWQRRAQQHAAQVHYAREIMSAYQTYVRQINASREPGTSDQMDEIHAQMLTQTKLARFLFRDPRVSEDWNAVATDLTDAGGFKRTGHPEKASHRMVSVYRNAESAIEAMYNELRS